MDYQTKQNKLNSDCTEVMFTITDKDKNSNKFQDRCETIMKRDFAKKYKWSLYNWTETKITYLVSDLNKINKVNHNNYTPRMIDAKILNQLEDVTEPVLGNIYEKHYKFH